MHDGLLVMEVIFMLNVAVCKQIAIETRDKNGMQSNPV